MVVRVSNTLEKHLSQSSPRPVNDQGFCLLSLGIATASFIHMLSFPWWRGMISGQILLASTLLLFFLPRSIFALSFFLLTSLFFWFQKLPFVPNHIFFEILVHASMLGTILVVSIYQWKKSPSSQELRGLIYEHMRPVVMSALIIMYLFTVLHKLNWDFLNPAVSCSVSMHKELATLVPFVPSGIWTHWPTIIGTLFFELIIPLGLWWRKTRVAAVLVGLFFHWFLALHPHGGIYSFSHLLYVLYAVFLFSSRDNPFDTRIKIPRFGVLAIKLAAVFLFGLALFLQMRAYKSGNGFFAANAIGFYTWLIFATWLVVTMNVVL